MPHKCKQTYQQPLHLITLRCCCFFKFALLLSPDNNEQPSISVLFSIAYKGSTRIIELSRAMHTLTCQIATANQQGQRSASSFSPCRSHQFECSLYSAAAVHICGTGTLEIFISCQIWVEVLEGSVVLGQRHTLCTLISQTKKAQRSALKFFQKSPLDYTHPENIRFLIAGVSCSAHFRSASAGHQMPPPTS